jgi:hypothetical protein
MAQKAKKPSAASQRAAAPKVFAAQVANAKEQEKAVKDKKAAYKKAKKTLVQITGPVIGAFKLPYKIGQEVEIETKLATELLDAGFAQKVEKA